MTAKYTAGHGAGNLACVSTWAKPGHRCRGPVARDAKPCALQHCLAHNEAAAHLDHQLRLEKSSSLVQRVDLKQGAHSEKNKLYDYLQKKEQKNHQIN